MSAEMWRFVVVVVFFAAVLLVSYWFVLLPDRWTKKLDEARRDEEGEEKDRR